LGGGTVGAGERHLCLLFGVLGKRKTIESAGESCVDDEVER
jgi:hypothetical protein